MTTYPDGLDARHADPSRMIARQFAWLALFVLAALLTAAMLGLFGGQPSPVRAAEGPAARLIVQTPRVLRNGEFFETRIRIEARRAIAKPVLAVSASYWRDITINTTHPEAASETARAGMLEFEYDPLQPGEVLDIKIDGQINPPLFAGNRGRIELRDDAAPIAAIPLSLRVMP